MGGIELDPASCALANTVVQAERIFDLQMDGLLQSWVARSVWLNPPFGRTGKNESSQEIWSCKLIAEHEKGNVREATLLVNAVTETGWFQRLWDYPICFVRGRVKFHTPNSRVGGPTCGSVLVYFGPQRDRFKELFQPLGQVILPAQVSVPEVWWREEI
jgi:ParB family chromosome partitioning protein